MGLFRKKPRGGKHQPPEELPPAERAAAALKAWAGVHFPRPGGLRFAFYRTAAGTEISLRGGRIENPEIAAEFGNETADKFSQYRSSVQIPWTPLPAAAKKFADAVQTALAIYRDHASKRAALDEFDRNDVFFERIGDVFAAKLTALLHELNYCQFERCGGTDNAYCTAVMERLTAVLRELKTVNRLCADYLYALTRAELTDASAELEALRISVQSMTEVTGNASQTGV